MNGDQLPPEFMALIGQVDYIHKVSENEYHSSCPNCGGEQHSDGSWPDRFVMWRSSRRGEPFGMCIRKCGFKWSPEKQDANWTPEERAEFIRKQTEMEAEWMAKENERIALLAERVMQQETWRRCYDYGQECKEIIRYWERRGIPDMWQKHLFVGAFDDYTVRGRNATYSSLAYTIPVWNSGDKIENITLRVANPHDSNDRYRRLYKSKAQHLYFPMHGAGINKKVVLLEGEIKAAVATIYSKFNAQHSIFGVQSKSPERRILKMPEIAEAEVVYLAFDPDAYLPEYGTGRVAVLETARQIGYERCRLVIPPPGMKFDDAILKGYRIDNAINMAIKPERLQ